MWFPAVAAAFLAAASVAHGAGGYREACGRRLSGLEGRLNRTSSPLLDVEAFVSDEETFPWLLDVRSLAGELLCSGVAVSSHVAVVPAHCVAGEEDKTGLTVGDRAVENIVVHPDFVRAHPSRQHDLAVVKIREMGGRFEMFACLPGPGDDPVDRACQATGFVDREDSGKTIVAHDVEFGPSVICAEETPQLRGYLDSHESILCSEGTQPCTPSVSGPVFCQGSSRTDVIEAAGLSTDASNWCSVGAYTRLAWYVDWIEKSISYLEGEPIPERPQHAERELSREEKDNKTTEPETNLPPCASNPCGPRAVCWNSGENFMCTCSNQDYPKGNPYKGCFECLYDQNCNQGLAEGPLKCVNNTCQRPEEQPNLNVEISPSFAKTESGSYYISNEELPWAQAQHDCQRRNGQLVEVNGEGAELPADLAELLGKKNATRGGFWIGGSDLGEGRKFIWFTSGEDVSEANWPQDQKPEAVTADTEQRCLQVSVEGTWLASSCKSKSRYICAYATSDSLDVDNPVEGSRSERQRAFFDTLDPNAKYGDICGRRFVNLRGGRIVGGGLASYGEWPWQVSLRQYKRGQFRHKCGAALLTHEWIVTAAHCVKDVTPSNLMVRVGEYNVFDRTEAHRHMDRRVTRMVVHSGFDRSTYEYDIALLKVSSPVPFQPNAIPICLPSTKSDLVGKVGSVTGWGRKSEYGQISPVLREVHLPIISNKKCMSMYRLSGQNEWIPKIFLCAGTSNGGKDSCEGDSGGPLAVKGRNGRYELAGIISWGIGCGDRNRPGVYTRISEFKNWIVRNSGYSL